MKTATLVILLLASALSQSNAACAGCSTPVKEPNSKEMRDIVSRTLSKTNAGYELTNIKSCKSQVVSGVKFDCEIEVKSPDGHRSECQLSVLQKPWLEDDKQEIISETCSSLNRAKRATCAGCPSETDANSEEMKNKLKNVLSRTNSDLSLVKGQHCSSQVVAGIKYQCTIQVESPKINGVHTCQLVFVEQPWKDPKINVIEDTCSPLTRNKRDVCAGCPIEQDADTPEMKKTLTKILEQTNSGLTLVKGKKCTSQVVSGVKYTCTLQVMSPKINQVETCTISYLEQPWLNPNPTILTDTCSQLTRSKRDLLGGRKDVEANEKVLVQELATFAVKTLDDIDADNNQRLVAHIISAQKQLVNGIMYYLKLRVSPTSCDEEKEINEDCLSGDNGPQKICDIQIHRSFADKSPLNAKVVKSECAPVSDFMKLGGYEPVHTNSDEVQNAAKFATKRISEMVNSMYVKRLISIEKAETQVVSGINYAMTLLIGDTDCMKNKMTENSVCKVQQDAKMNLVCQVVVNNKPWEKVMKISSMSCQDVPNVSVQRARRSVLGDYQPVETNDDKIQKVAEFAAQRINERVNSIYEKKMIAIEQAQTQVVAGRNYALTILLGDTECMKNKPVNTDCKLQSTSKMNLLCQVVVYVNLENVPKLTSMDCKDVPKAAVRERRATLLGGYHPVETNDDSVEKVAAFAAGKINQQVNSIYVKKIIAVEQAQTQVVAGRNYALTILLGDTECMKNKPVNTDCKLQSTSKSNLQCSVVVYVNLKNEMKLTSSKCNDVPAQVSVRQVRSLAGGESDVDVNDPAIQGLKNFLSQEITHRTNSPNLFRVTKTISASKQVVSGMLYKVKLLAAVTECPSSVNTNPDTCPLSNSNEQQNCDVTVWVRPWLNKKEITAFNCQKNGDAVKTLTYLDVADEEINRLASMLNTTLDDVEFHKFSTFLASHNKVYPSESEYQKRFSIFRANMKKVKYLQDTEQGTGRYGATQFADLTKSEFKKYYLGFKMEEGRWPQRPQAEIPDVTLPQEFDWRDHGAVSEVKNQGMCGSCWAFSVTGNIEGQYAIKNNKMISLSEQELVDCDKYDAGCNGGFFDSAFHAIEDMGGLETEKDYPYEGVKDNCKFSSDKIKVSITSSVNISSDETHMAKWLYKNGPISVALNANAMQFYMGGVSHPLKFLCSADNLDHGVLIVGYGVHTTSILKRRLPYWIVKNSWGRGWGKQGYYWLYRGDGACGINKMPTSAVL